MGTLYNRMKLALVPFIALLALTFPASSFSVEEPVVVTIIATGGSPIPSSFSKIDPQSQVLTGLSNKSHISIIKTFPEQLFIHISTAEVRPAPADVNEKSLVLPATTGLFGEVHDGIKVDDTVYIRTASPVTSGTVIIKVW